jgi:hypothetical protein
MLFDHLEKYKNNVLFYEDNTKIFYDQIFSFEKKFKNLKKNKLILFICENSSAFLMTYISLIRKNLVIMLVDQNSDNEEIKELILSYKPSYIFMKKKLKLI